MRRRERALADQGAAGLRDVLDGQHVDMRPGPGRPWRPRVIQRKRTAAW
jgi:hypothetical protein